MSRAIKAEFRYQFWPMIAVNDRKVFEFTAAKTSTRSGRSNPLLMHVNRFGTDLPASPGARFDLAASSMRAVACEALYAA
jgi:hypothetical protein